LDNRYFDSVIKEMQPFFDENGFESCECGGFKNGKKAVKVEYSEERQMYLLLLADVDENGSVGEFTEAEAWLFDDSQNAKDAESVGIDFTETLRENMGIKAKRVNQNIDLPTANKDGVYNIAAFTKKALDTFPQYKDTYKEYVAKYGNFLYLNFYGTYIVPAIKTTLSENTKKSVKKVSDLVSDAYVSGDKETVNLVVACLAAACYKDENITNIVNDMFADNTHFKSAVNSFALVLDRKKKIKEVLVK